MTAAPQVSVGIPVYNGARFLPATVAALQAQSLADIEIVISDNGSTDGTEAICREAAAADGRIVYTRVAQNQGMGWNYNRALEMARAPLFMWNAADDIALPSYLARCVTGLLEHPDAVLATSRIATIDATGQVTGGLEPIGPSGASADPIERIRRFLDTQAWDVVYGVVRTELLRGLGGMPHITGDDIVLGVALLLRGPLHYIDDPLFQRRFHADQLSAQHDPAAGALQQDPTSRPWLTFPNWVINAYLYRHVAQAPLPARQRAAAAGAVLASWTAPQARRLLGDVRRTGENIRHRLGERRAGRARRTA